MGDVRLHPYGAARGLDIGHPELRAFACQRRGGAVRNRARIARLVFAGTIGRQPASSHEDELGQEQQAGEQRDASADQQQRQVAHEPGDERDERDGERGQRRERALLRALPCDRGARLLGACRSLLLIGELAERFELVQRFVRDRRAAGFGPKTFDSVGVALDACFGVLERGVAGGELGAAARYADLPSSARSSRRRSRRTSIRSMRRSPHRVWLRGPAPPGARRPHRAAPAPARAPRRRSQRSRCARAATRAARAAGPNPWRPRECAVARALRSAACAAQILAQPLEVMMELVERGARVRRRRACDDDGFRRRALAAEIVHEIVEPRDRLRRARVTGGSDKRGDALFERVGRRAVALLGEVARA